MKNARLLDVISYIHPLGTFKSWYESFTVFQDCFSQSLAQEQFDKVILSDNPRILFERLDLTADLYVGVFSVPSVFKITTGTVDWYIEYDPSSTMKNQSFTREFLCYHMAKDPNANILSAFNSINTNMVALPPSFVFDIHAKLMDVEDDAIQKSYAFSTYTDDGYFEGSIVNVRHHTDRVSFLYDGAFVIGEHRLSIRFQYEGQDFCTRGILKWKEGLPTPPSQMSVSIHQS
jgi:hypothetical protein